MTSPAPMPPLRVEAVADETPTIRRILLAAADGAPLPGFDAGAHITLEVPHVGPRKYSLVDVDPTPAATRAPRMYRLGVRLEPSSTGGSRWVHGLKTGDSVTASGPDNNFPLRPGPTRTTLLGGGIGITPLLTMAAALKASGRPFRIVSATRSAAETAFRAEIAALAADAAHFHIDDEAGHVVDIAAMFAALEPGEPVYACGPKPMLKTAIATARKLGWPRDRLSFELFYSVATP
jgi:vanillate O-demethylase ferredoxin subunit